MAPISGKKRFLGTTLTSVAYVLAEELSAVSENRSTIVVVPDMQSGEELLSSLRFFLTPSEAEASAPTTLPVTGLFGWEVLPFDGLSPTPPVTAARILALDHFHELARSVVVTTPAVLMQRLPLPKNLFAHRLRLCPGDELDRESLYRSLDRLGYSRSTVVQELGQLAVRGAIIDVFPPGVSLPIRIEMFGDTIESIRHFDPESQRSLTNRDDVRILPIRELFLPWESSVGDSETLRRDAVSRLRARASELQLPLRHVGLIEESFATGVYLPGVEHLQPLLDPELVSLREYAASPLRVVLVYPGRVFAEVEATQEIVLEQSERAASDGRLFPVPDSAWFRAEDTKKWLQSEADFSFEQMLLSSDEPFEPISVQPVTGVRDAVRARRWADKPFLPLVEEIRKRDAEGYRAAVVIQQMSRAPRVEELLGSYDIPVMYPGPSFREWAREETEIGRRSAPVVTVLKGHLPEGLLSESRRILVFSESDLFGETARAIPSSTGKSVKRFIASSLQLQENDFIVHIEHGIGVYRGLRTIEVDGRPGDFLQLEYAEGAKLFLPVENLGKIQKYAGADARRPTLSKLGGKVWQATKGKVRAQVVELAGQLVQIFAEREIVDGVEFGPEDADDRMFADTFPFEETADQQQSIQDVFADLNKGRPMDRLICGDVGYGKTEVAIRAAFKVANAGKQVALLAPTTVLVDQHFQTFQKRFEDTPIRLGMVSRFRTPQENKETIAKVLRGEIDIVIGTHRLLQRDVSFKDLGLVVVDEEHRFGVAHKEKLKRFRAEVHVLTLTATPIPRTLHMSMVGIRDLSVIETPPVNRQLIRTHVAAYSDGVIREAIMRELGRSGQIFFIHNRVENIASVAAHVAQLVPEARIGFGHGQMRESELEGVMHRFIQREIDVLVSTTIVESGLDIPNANTIIIRHADKFGLAELYQLRGRVGRSSRKAYAYLLVNDPQSLTGDAQRRLQVLQSLDDLGLGFRLALQDLEIRGAGNLLGRDQSGHIHVIGFELYSRILKEAIEEERARRRGDRRKKSKVLEIDPEMRIGFPAHIPEFYIPDVAERLLLYQRLIGISDEQQGEDMLEEIEDRFGNPPNEVHLLIHLMMFRAVLRDYGIVQATLRKGALYLAIHPEIRINPETVTRIVTASSGALRITPAQSFVVRVNEEELNSPKELIGVVRDFGERLGIRQPRD